MNGTAAVHSDAHTHTSAYTSSSATARYHSSNDNHFNQRDNSNTCTMTVNECSREMFESDGINTASSPKSDKRLMEALKLHRAEKAKYLSLLDDRDMDIKKLNDRIGGLKQAYERQQAMHINDTRQYTLQLKHELYEHGSSVIGM
jgi:hypothetical protein